MKSVNNETWYPYITIVLIWYQFQIYGMNCIGLEYQTILVNLIYSA